MSTPKILSLIFLLFPLWYFLFNFPFLHLAPNFPEGREMGTTRTNLGTSLIITYPEKPFGKTSLVRIFPQNWHSSTFFFLRFSRPVQQRPNLVEQVAGGRGFALGRAAPGLGSFQTATAGPVVVRRRRRGDDHTFSVDLVRPIVHSLLTRVGTGQRRPGPGSAIALFSRVTKEDRERCR